MTSLALEPIFDSWLLIVVLSAFLLGVPFLVAVHGDSLNVRRRRMLTGLRVGTAALLLLAAIRPAVLSTDTLPARATLAVLLDQSRSMTLPADEGESRWEVQQEVWEELAPAIARLDESMDLRVIGYSDEATELTAQEIASGDDAQSRHRPDGTATDIAAALSAALRVSAGQPLAGVVLVGDGVHNPPRSGEASNRGPHGDPQNIARTLASLDVPLWSIGIGPPGDADQVRDVEIDQLPQSLSLFSGNEFNVDFAIRSRALQGVELPVRIRLSDESDPDSSVEVATRRHTPARAVDSTSMSIPIIAPAPGSYRLEVSVDPQEGETLLSNNSQYAFVDVREGGGRILYLEGHPGPEQQSIRWALRRFPDLEVTYRWISQDDSGSWPVDLGDVLRPGMFDIYLIGDLPAAALGNAQLGQLATAVEAGSGLLAIGGLQAFDAGGYGSSPLARVLPVQLAAGAADPGDNVQLQGPITPQIAMPHPITTLNAEDLSPAAQQSAWDALPPLVGANRFAGTRVAPGINVLLQSPGEDPLLVVGEYGQGRVVAFAGDSTWRWRRQGHDAAHRRFWRQTILWLLDRSDDADAEIIIDMPERRIEPAAAAPWRVIHRSATPGVDLALEIVAADGATTPLEPSASEIRDAADQGDDGNASATLEGTIPRLPPGLYRLRAAVSGTELAAEKSFQVLDDDRELARPYADLTYLAQLSGQTAASGGASFLPSQVDELIQRITELRRTSALPVVKKYRLGDTPASAWPLFLLVVGLLTAEWVLRRRWGLV